MSGAIPLKVKSMPEGGTIGGGVKAIAHEILSYLERLVETGETAAVDLKSLPISPDEFNGLKEMLGQGELDLVIDLDGPTRLRETAYAGVWWIQHRGTDDRVQSEYIEINRTPDFLNTDIDHIRQAITALSDRLKGAPSDDQKE